MPNLVEITIKSTDLTGPGFLSALAKIEALKEAAKGIGFNLDDPGLAGELLAIKQKMQAVGLADLLDYNLNAGEIESQLLMLKRKIAQAGISDLLDVNLNQSKITEQLDKLSDESVDVPVAFKEEQFPHLGEGEEVEVPVRFDIPKMPDLTDNLNIGGLSEATHQLDNLVSEFNAAAMELHQLDSVIGDSVPEVADLKEQFSALGGELAAAMESGDASEETFANLTQRIIEMGTALDHLEKQIPGVVTGMEDISGPQVVDGLHSVAGMYDDVANAIEGVRDQSSVTAEQIAELGDKFNIAANELHQLDGVIGDATPEIGELKDRFADLGNEIEQASSSANISEENFENLTMRLEAMGKVLDSLEEDIPAILQDMRSMADPQVVEGLNSIAGMYDHVADELIDVEHAAAAAGGDGGVGGLNKTLNAGGASWGRYGGWLQGSVALFGSSSHAVGLWHIALDGAFETLISVGLATTALGIGMYGLAPAAIDMVNRLKAIDAANDALTGIGNSGGIPPLTHAIGQFQDALAPAAVEIYGGALNILKNQTNVLGQTMTEVVGQFEDWTAKLDIWAKSQGNFGGLLQSGVGYLDQFVGILDDLGEAFANLLKDDPGTAHFLLDVLGGVAKAIQLFTELPHPIVETVLALHSVYLWGGLAVTALTKLASATGLTALSEKMGLLTTDAESSEKAFLGLSSVSWGGIIIAGVGIGLLADKLMNADTAAQNLVGNMNKALSSMDASQSISAINTDLGTLNQAMLHTPDLVNNVSDAMKKNSISFDTAAGNELKARNMSQLLGNAWIMLKDSGNTLMNPLKMIAAYFGDTEQVSTYKGEIDNLTAGQTRLFQESGNLMHVQPGLTAQFGKTGTTLVSTKKSTMDFSDALALMDAAGVKSSDSLQIMQQKVANLKTGFANMGDSAGILTSAVNAVTFAEEMSKDKTSQVTSAFSGFIGMVTGSQDALTQFVLGVKPATSGLDKVVLAANDGKTSMNGLSDASMTLRQNFSQAVNSASDLYNALMTQNAAAGLGAKGTGLMVNAGKDLVGTLLDQAKGSKAAVAQLYALAQTAGYQGADSFQSLSKWVGNTKDSESDLNKITNTLTIASAGLTTDMDNLSNALGHNFSQAAAMAIFEANGGQKAFSNFANAAVKSNDNLSAMKPTAQALANELIATTGNTKDAENEFIVFAEQLHLTKAQAEQLWNSLSGTGHTALTNITTDLDNQQKAADNAKTSLNNLTTAVVQNGQDSNQAKSARQQLITDLVNAGIKSTTATTDVNNYSRAVADNGTDSNQARAARQQLITDILNATKNSQNAKTALQQYNQMIQNNQQNTAQGHSVRQELITDLENAGVHAQTATSLVDGLTKSIHSVPSSASTKFTDTGTGKITILGETPGGNSGLPGYPGNAAGGFITGPGNGTSDSILAMLSNGEFVINAAAVDEYGLGLLNAINTKQYASGGPVSGLGPWEVDTTAAFGNMVNKATENALSAAFNSAMKKAEASSVGGTAGPGGGDPLANSMLAYHLYQSQLTPASWSAWNSVAMAESGWNQYADNPASGAYGIAQALPQSKYPPAGQASGGSNPMAQITWMWNYMAATYGGPLGAWAHEEADHWYGAGGATSSGWGVVGEHGRELIKLPGGANVTPHGQSEAMLGGGNSKVCLEIAWAGGNSGADKGFVSWLRHYIRVNGGVMKVLGP